MTARRLSLAVATTLVLSGSAPAGDLRVVDSRGTEVVVAEAVVDYGGFFSGDHEADGIRVLQGDGVVLLKWINVDTLRVVRVDSEPAWRLDIEVVLRNHRRVPASLFQKGNMKISGRSDLGDYAIDLKHVRSIIPVRGRGTSRSAH
jgi:hypothetical protein